MTQVSNLALSDALFDRNSEHSRLVYQKVALMVLKGKKQISDFAFTPANCINFAHKSDDQPIFINIEKLLNTFQELEISSFNQAMFDRLFKFCNSIADPNQKVHLLVSLYEETKGTVHQKEALNQLLVLPKLSAQNEYFLLEHAFKDVELSHKLYPIRYAYLDPNLGYALIFKEFGLLKNDAILQYLIATMQKNYCINEVIRYLRHKAETGNASRFIDKLAIVAFQRYGLTDQADSLNMELLLDLINSRLLKNETNIEILKLTLKNSNNRKLILKLGNLSLISNEDQILAALSEFDNLRNHPQDCAQFYLAVMAKSLQSPSGIMAINKFRQLLILDSNKLLSTFAADGTLLRFFKKVAVSNPSAETSKLINSILELVTSSTAALNADLLRIIAENWEAYAQTWIYNCKKAGQVTAFFTVICQLYPQQHLTSPFAALEGRLVDLTVKVYLKLYRNGANQIARLLYEQGYGQIVGLPFEVRQAIAIIEAEEKEFQNFLTSLDI